MLGKVQEREGERLKTYRRAGNTIDDILEGSRLDGIQHQGGESVIEKNRCACSQRRCK